MDSRSGGRGVSVACTAREHKPRHAQAEHPEAGEKGTRRIESEVERTPVCLSQDFVFVNMVNDRRDDMNDTSRFWVEKGAWKHREKYAVFCS